MGIDTHNDQLQRHVHKSVSGDSIREMRCTKALSARWLKSPAISQRSPINLLFRGVSQNSTKERCKTHCMLRLSKLVHAKLSDLSKSDGRRKVKNVRMEDSFIHSHPKRVSRINRYVIRYGIWIFVQFSIFNANGGNAKTSYIINRFCDLSVQKQASAYVHACIRSSIWLLVSTRESVK